MEVHIDDTNKETRQMGWQWTEENNITSNSHILGGVCAIKK